MSFIHSEVFNYFGSTMVLCASYNSRAHSSILPYDYDDCDDGDVCRYEVPTSMPRGGVVVPTSQPISLRLMNPLQQFVKIRSPYSTDDDLADSPPMERLYSPLSSSAESISSIKSSSSSRSSAEREIERQQRRQLLDASLLKMRASNNMPLRKHLLVYNTVKQLQRDLDLLDDEELYCNLMGEGCGERMDVDERRWPSFGGIGGGGMMTTSTGSPCMTMTSSSLPSLTSSEGDVVVSSAAATAAAAVTSATATVAPPQQEERRVAEEATSLISDDLDMDVCQQMPQQQQAPTWSWTTTDTTSTTTTTTCGGTTMTGSGGFHLFESIQDALGESFAGWSWSTDDTSSYSSSSNSSSISSSNSYSSSSDLWWSAGGSGLATPFGATSRLDSLWGVGADPLGAANLSRFELQHLFPSQVLLQA